MRLALALAFPPLLAGSALLISISGACGGTAFTAGTPDDAGPLSDAPVLDGGDAGPAGSFCSLEAGVHTFCDDFDGPTLTTVWPTYDRSSGATAQDDTSVFVSAPNSFESACPSSGGAVVGGLTLIHARIGKQFTGASHVVLGFEVHIDAVGVKPNGAGGTTFALLTLGANYSIGLTANQDNINGYEDITEADGGTLDTTDTIVPTKNLLGNWAHVVMDIDLGAAKFSANVGGTPFGPITITPPTGIAPIVYIGLTSRNVALPVEAHYDNVTIDATP